MSSSSSARLPTTRRTRSRHSADRLDRRSSRRSLKRWPMSTAVRAIAQIGTDDAYAVLAEALKSSSVRARDAIMQALVTTRDERAAPLFIYILEHTDHRGVLQNIYLSALGALGKLGGDADSVAALNKVLYRNEWWAPRRTARLRLAAATALCACGSAESARAIDDAATGGPRGVRKA